MAEPTPPFEVRAIAAYGARNDAEVSLDIGKVYTVLQTDGKGLWWQTRGPAGNIGWFPASYTEQVPKSAPAPPPPAPTPSFAPPNNFNQFNSSSAQPRPVSQPSFQASQPRAPVQPQSSFQPPQLSLQPQPAPQAMGFQPSQSVRAMTPRQESAPMPSSGGPREKPPPPSRPPMLERDPTPAYVKLQVIEAKGLKSDPSKTDPTVFIYRRKVLDTGPGDEIFKTNTCKKTVTPKWNELFQVNVHDAESEILSIRICDGKKFKPKVKEGYLGEINFALRGAARDFDQPGYQFKWYPLKGNKLVQDNEVGGDVLLYIQFLDTRQSQGPTNFQHTSHVGWTQDGGFDVNNIPAEWKKIFQSVGIRKADLVNNPSLAQDLFKIMNDAAALSSEGAAPAPPPQPGGSAGYEQQGGYDQGGGYQENYDRGGGGYDQGGYNQYEEASAPPPPPMQQQHAAPPPPPMPSRPSGIARGGAGGQFGSVGGGNAPAPPPPPMANRGGPMGGGNAPAPPPPPMGGMGARGPPPMPGGGGGHGGPPPTPGGGFGGPPPPPPPPGQGDMGGGGVQRGGLLADIARGASLRRVDTNAPKPAAPPPSDAGGLSLADTLKKAMIAHRKDIEGQDNAGGDNDEWD